MFMLGTLMFVCVSFIGAKEDFCPKQCDCYMENDLKIAVCENQNIISIDVGVPIYVQVYNLPNNAISELDNLCFKNSGYIYLKFINLSYNRIFWIGLHAFSGLDELMHVDLSNNRLRTVPADVFWDNPLVEYLDLSGNVFETLKNEPFLMHPALKVLNLSNCRMTSIPIRMFTRLPNLRKLDLSDNYMIGLQIPALTPIKRLERLELRNEYWKCTPDFLATEAWIMDHVVDYRQQCRKLPKMSEKIIAVESQEKEDIEIGKVWNITKSTNATTAIKKSDENLTFFERFHRYFPSLWALLMGFEVGLVLGIMGTYVWLRSLCTCGGLQCATVQTPRQRRRRVRNQENELRVNLLWTAAVNSTVDTPPSRRRELELPEGYPPRIVRSAERREESESPPPPYATCRAPWVFNSTSQT